MRELKFRVWDKEHNMMHTPEGDEISQRNDLYLDPTGAIVEHYNYELNMLDVTTYDVLRCVGVADKTGVDIYEGDILELSSGATREVKDIVEFLMYCGAYKELHGVDFCDSLVVKGNIYEQTL